MTPECYSLAQVPGTSALFRDFADAGASGNEQELRQWYPSDPFSIEWSKHSPHLPQDHRARLADALLLQAESFRADALATANIERIRNGAATVVTGQQVSLFGGPLLTLLKAATAVRKAQDATSASGREHVPVFWLASEDHDLAEVDQVTLLSKTQTEKLRLGLRSPRPLPVGKLHVDGGDERGAQQLTETLDKVSELLSWAPVCDLLRAIAYTGLRSTRADRDGRVASRVSCAWRGRAASRD